MVMGSAWRKNNLRELRHSIGRYLAILSIIALGVGFFAGLKAAKPAMLLTGQDYLNETKFYDFRLITTLGLTQEDERYFASLDGVAAAEGAVSVDAVAETGGRERTVKILTLTDRVNLPKLTAGRMPQTASECLADTHRFSEKDRSVKLSCNDNNSEQKRKKHKKFIFFNELHQAAECSFVILHLNRLLA